RRRAEARPRVPAEARAGGHEQGERAVDLVAAVGPRPQVVVRPDPVEQWAPGGWTRRHAGSLSYPVRRVASVWARRRRKAVYHAGAPVKSNSIRSRPHVGRPHGEPNHRAEVATGPV